MFESPKEESCIRHVIGQMYERENISSLYSITAGKLHAHEVTEVVTWLIWQMGLDCKKGKRRIIFFEWISLNSKYFMNHDKIQKGYGYQVYYLSGNGFIPSI